MNSWLDRLRQHDAFDAAGLLFLLGYGLVAVLRPSVVIRWVQSAYPNHDLNREPSVPHWIRGIGTFIILFSLFLWVKLVH